VVPALGASASYWKNSGSSDNPNASAATAVVGDLVICAHIREGAPATIGTRADDAVDRNGGGFGTLAYLRVATKTAAATSEAMEVEGMTSGLWAAWCAVYSQP
jgi:hypothetical protein